MLQRLLTDCDQDALVAEVTMTGDQVACHTGTAELLLPESRGWQPALDTRVHLGVITTFRHLIPRKAESATLVTDCSPNCLHHDASQRAVGNSSRTHHGRMRNRKEGPHVVRDGTAGRRIARSTDRQRQ
jgi:hypothetical protein